jgi:hypothetical protein
LTHDEGIVHVKLQDKGDGDKEGIMDEDDVLWIRVDGWWEDTWYGYEIGYDEDDPSKYLLQNKNMKSSWHCGQDTFLNRDHSEDDDIFSKSAVKGFESNNGKWEIQLEELFGSDCPLYFAEENTVTLPMP